MKRFPLKTQTKASLTRHGWLALAALALLTLAGSAWAAPPAKNWADGRILVQPRAGLSATELGNVLKGHGAKSASKIGKINVHVVQVPPGAEDAVVEALSHNPHIKFAEKDMLVSAEATVNDPSSGSQWYLSKVQAPAAWDNSRGDSVVVAILDTGLDATHPDFAGKVVAGWNFYSNNSDTSDVHGHGTWVAGVAGAATNNATGIAAVGYNAKIMPVRIADPTGYAYWSTTATALQWAADKGAKVANISYNGVSGSSTVQSAAQYFRSKGGVVIVAAGNSGGLESIAETPYLTSVAATTSTDTRASFSSYGAYVDLSAPGTSMVTTARGGGYATVQGTSFASPCTAGVAALMFAANPLLTPNQMDSLLEQTADDLGDPGWDQYFGHGRVNANAAVVAAKQAQAADTQAPTVSLTAPAPGAVVQGLVPVNVSAWDNVGVTKVDLYVNGALKATDATQPFAFTWDSSTLGDGPATLTAYAYDAAGNRGAASSVSVTVDNVPDPVDTTPPTVKITSPANGVTVSGTVTITVTASDDVGISLLQAYVDGASLCVNNLTSLSCNWNTRKVASGTHTISAKAQDAKGNTTTTSIQVVTGSTTSAVVKKK